MSTAHSCLGCGRLTTAKCQICRTCMHDRDSGEDILGSAFSCGPLTELYDEYNHDYSEDALGPHTSDERWSWQYTDDVEMGQYIYFH